MVDARAILTRARQGSAPAGWRVFTKRRGKVSGFLRGTSGDPDPLLVITSDEVVEYRDERRPLTAISFSDLDGVTLNATARSRHSDSMFADLDVWLDLVYRDGRKEKWRSGILADDLRTVQGFIEAYAVYRNRNL
ncbi:hypothetical protein GL263_18385 [Streptomyces durbertensis]|uniref:ASCH domain-containing protein n=1 Tax=Streptomyces durbertensis TaxID=2448886 RepID=A0ABR6EJJ4_9ACTN|nr:hypothetical protein [Streptomyces durbertensis]MBB1245512.1 hypothetical protein [Streptomyces durbertensis]